MDKDGHIYELSEEERELALSPFKDLASEDQEKVIEMREDVARLAGYLHGRSDSDAPKRGKGVNQDLVG